MSDRLDHFFKKLSAALVAATLVTSVSGQQRQPLPGTSAADLGLTYLSNEPSRQTLFQEIVKSVPAETTKAIQQDFNLYGPFRFPNDATFDKAVGVPRADSLFGVDISHYTAAEFPIEKLHQRQVLFLYMKATQGTKMLDPKFATFWSRAGQLPKSDAVHRGAYHFLSSTNPNVPHEKWSETEARAFGAAQADVFVKVVTANGGLLKTDMPPVVDLEWDKASADGPDRWKQRSSAQILAMLQGYLEEVKAKLHRTPMIYTAQAWCREHNLESNVAGLTKYPIWIADYSKTAQISEKPKSLGSTPSSLWQFTEKAEMAIGFNGAFDANIYKGKEADFYRVLDIESF